MSKLIDSNVLTKEIAEIYNRVYSKTIDQCIHDFYNSVCKAIRRVSTTDYVEVIRCKDCKWLRIDKEFASGRYCALRNVNGGKFCKDNDFCSYGQQRSGSNDKARSN